MTKAPPAYNLHTPVIFRMLDGECVAIFPTLPWGTDPNECTSYQHIGQHGACDITISSKARLATKAEYKSLKRELQRLGYRLKVISRVACAHNNERRAAISRTEGGANA